MLRVKLALGIRCYTCDLGIHCPALNFAARRPIEAQYRRRSQCFSSAQGSSRPSTPTPGPTANSHDPAHP
ncbi:hypothetical protein CBM2592_A90578 [Cupriavidus taiwanensis]|nr:hypothetical protein CBM2588_A60483 [Cupriavidus taiwanensis]SOY57370.1 hypothetical protein CBM2592_A90578 [Cupriavidus taiwanensis]SOY79377.1 hypothetical protein CBM2591_A100269 [Cupriavidus taiwanensis]SOZ65285.1 hypothetical protein CBM2617_A90171 [Cupriavidus taiwanensis]SOZ76549.1 hypothetical protein CBM2618_A100170 [Cupriavidus taiwanensis]